MTVRFLKAQNGDCIHIHFKDQDGVPRNILIDGGVSETFIIEKDKKGKRSPGDLYRLIERIRTDGQKLDLLIMTHHHDDHIDGILTWFSKDPVAHETVGEVWFNTGGAIAKWMGQEENENLNLIFTPPPKTNKTSISQALDFGKYIQQHGKWHSDIIIAGGQLNRFGIAFRFLSPDRDMLQRLLEEWKKKDPNLKTAAKGNDYTISLADHIAHDNFVEDDSAANGSSIAFIMKWRDKNFLFLGDAHPGVVTTALNRLDYNPEHPLHCEFVKIAHHGSAGNTSHELLKIIDSDSFIISTNGYKHEHPHKKLLGRLVKEKSVCNIYFNYQERINQIFTEQDLTSFPRVKAIPITTEFEYNDN